MSAGLRVPVPTGLRRTIQNIKEITGNHSDEEVYTMLKECSMDPNETAQKLLLQDTFHEVKRKRDKKKENTRELADPRWRPGVLGRGGRGGRGGYSTRFLPNDTGGGRNASAGKENGVNQGTNKGNASSSTLPTPTMDNKTSTSVSSIGNGPTKADHQASFPECTTQASGAIGVTSAAATKGLGSSSDPVVVPSIDARVPGAVGAIRREVGSQRMVIETTGNNITSRDVAGPETFLSGKRSPEFSSTSVHGKMQSKSQSFEVKQLPDTSHAVPSSSVTGSASSRPSSNYSNRSQQLSGSHKGTTKEWKPKSTNVNSAQPSGTLGTADTKPITAESIERPMSASSSMTSDITSLKLEKKLEDLQLSETHHVIIPHHLQVPESERHGLSFGSFDASFKLGAAVANGPTTEDSSTSASEISQEVEENVEEDSSSIHNESPTAQEAYSPDHPQTPAQMPENLSSRVADVPSGISSGPEFDQSKPEESSASDGSQFSVVQTIPTYSTFGLVPQMLNNQFASFESTDSQTRDATRVPNFVIQQPYDPSANFYAQIYRPSPDGDGRFSPFLAPGTAAKYNGSIAVLPPHAGLSPQESGNSLVLSSTGPTPLATQAAGVMQSSIAVTQQPVPVFRQPGGVHISHFNPNYVPYNHYYPQFYVPPPTLHHFLGNAAFPQQPPTGAIYPPSAAATGAPVKYPISQYKPGGNTGNPNHVGIPAYGAYNTSPAGYGPIPNAGGGNSTGSDDLTGSQYKENNVYITGQQQSEGSAVWISAPGRDMSGLPVNSFYNLPPQAQHMAFTPTQAGHGIYHPSQTVAAAGVHHPLLQQSQTMAGAAEAAGPPAGAYQQPQQRAQINWGNNY